MIKIYRKTDTIKAEQFDGSDEMREKYRIAIGSGWVVPYRINTFEGWVGVQINSWIATGVNGEHWPITDDVFKKTYAELPVIPENVACLIKQDKECSYNLGMVFNDAYFGHICEIGVDEWILAHTETFSRAWLDGYVVEE